MALEGPPTCDSESARGESSEVGAPTREQRCSPMRAPASPSSRLEQMDDMDDGHPDGYAGPRMGPADDPSNPTRPEHPPSDHAGAPVPVAQATAWRDETEDEAKAEEIDEAIAGITGNVGDASMTAAQIAANLDENDAGTGKVRKEEKKPRRMMGPSHSAAVQPERMENAESQTSSSQQPPPATPQSPQPSTQCSPSDPDVPIQIVEARLVEEEEEPSLPTYDATATVIPWWKEHQRFLIVALLLLIAAVIAIWGANTLSQRDERGGGTVPAAAPPGPGPSMPPTLTSSVSTWPTETMAWMPASDGPMVHTTMKPTAGPTHHIPTNDPIEEVTVPPSAYPSSMPSTKQPSTSPTLFPTPRPLDPIRQSSALPLVPDTTVIAHSSNANVAVYENTAIVGAPLNDNWKGAAFVFVRDPTGGTWAQQSTLVPPNGEDSNFGGAVDMHENTAVVGARYDGERGYNSGAAHVFARNGSAWSHEAKLVAPEGSIEAEFGRSVAIYDDVVVVGAKQRAHVFVRSEGAWTHRAELVVPDGAAPNNSFGCAVGIFEDTIVVGEYGGDVVSEDRGSTHVFAREGDAWTHQAKLFDQDGAAGDRFGWSVAISGDVIVVGAHLDDDNGDGSGAVHVFVRNATAWLQQTKLLAPNGSAGDEFGYSVDIHGNTVIVGAYLDDDNPAQSGSAHVFVRNGTEWTHRTALAAPDATSSGWFGQSVGVYDGTAIIDSGVHGGTYVFSG